MLHVHRSGVRVLYAPTHALSRRHLFNTLEKRLLNCRCLLQTAGQIIRHPADGRRAYSRHKTDLAKSVTFPALRCSVINSLPNNEQITKKQCAHKSCKTKNCVPSPKFVGFLKAYLQKGFSGERGCCNTKVHIVKHKIYNYAIVG